MPVESSIYDPFVITMIIIMLILLLAIVLLANVVIGAAGYFYEKEKERAQQQSGSTATTTAVVMGLLLFAAPAFAQNADTAQVVQATSIAGGLSPTAFYFIVGVIGMELLVIFILLYQLRVFLAKEKLQQHPEQATEYKLK